jgi:serine/threonine protein kinase
MRCASSASSAEARTISGLNHPNICVLHDVGREVGVEYLVVELLECETLADRLDRSALPLAEVLKYGPQIAEALDRAHRSGVVHRDLKPGNIMLTRTGAKLLDFGLARPTGVNSAVGSRFVATISAPGLHSPLTQEGHDRRHLAADVAGATGRPRGGWPQ